jgi:hypothetical protein
MGTQADSWVVLDKVKVMEHRLIRNGEGRHVMRVECDALFLKRPINCVSFPAVVELRDRSRPLLQIVAAGQRQPAALRGQEVGPEFVVNGTFGLLACLPGAFVTFDDFGGEVLEHMPASYCEAGPARSLSHRRLRDLSRWRQYHSTVEGPNHVFDSTSMKSVTMSFLHRLFAFSIFFSFRAHGANLRWELQVGKSHNETVSNISILR